MKERRQRSIEQKLGIFFQASITFCLAITAVGFAAILLFYSYRAFTQNLSSVARVVAATSRAAVVFDDHEAGMRVLSGLGAIESIQYAALFDQQGKLLAKFGPHEISPDTFPKIEKETFHWSLPALTLLIPIELEEERIGTLVVIRSLSSFYFQIFLLIFLSLVLVFVAAVGASYLSSQLRRMVSEPIVLLRDMTQQVSVTKDFSKRISLVSEEEDEVQQLIRSFNQMLDQIEERDRALLQAKERAEEADRMKSVFLATVSHELRTPMHAILGMTEEVLQTKVDSEQRELLEIVKNSGTLLVSIINDILDFSKIEAGKLALIPTKIEIRPLLDKVLQMFEISARKKGLKLELSLAPEIPRLIVVDGGRLVQILVNLMGNALKFTVSGSVKLSVHARGESARPNFQQLEFCISDTGVGIPEEALQTIFDSFTQLRRQGETTEGTGLGLSISSRLVRLMGGWIWAESTLGEGSRFYFVIEAEVLSESEANLAENIASASPSHFVPSQDPAPVLAERKFHLTQKFTVLVVEDNKVNRTLANRVLSKAGYHVLMACDGQECLDTLAREHVDIVLMDLSMPVMDGLTATKKIRELEARTEKHLPIVALTAHALDDQAAVCAEAGMDGFLTKPLAQELLFKTLARFLGHELPDGNGSTRNVKSS